MKLVVSNNKMAAEGLEHENPLEPLASLLNFSLQDIRSDLSEQQSTIEQILERVDAQNQIISKLLVAIDRLATVADIANVELVLEDLNAKLQRSDTLHLQ